MNNLLSTIINLILQNISPEIRRMVITFIAELDAQAKKTTSPVDDMFVALLKILFNC